MNKFMNIAIQEAKEGIFKGHGGPFGAVIVKDDEIISSGHNHVVSNNDPTCHGEIDAIRKACKKLNTFDLSGCEIYTTSAPCPMCLGAIQWANITKIYRGCTIEDAEKIGFRDKQFFENPIISNELDREECLQVFNDYSKMNKTQY